MNDAPGTHLESLIDAPDKELDYFVFKADTIPMRDSLVFYIQDEFAEFGVLTDCKLGAYSSAEKKFVYEAYIPAPASRYPNSQPSTWELQENGRAFPPNYLHESWRDYLYWDSELES